MNNKLNIYLLFNQEYKHLNKNHLLLQYKKNLNNENIIKDFNDFKNKYPNFNYDFYDTINNLNMNDEKKLILHWINYGIYNHLIYNKEDFYKLYDFDYNFYKKKYNFDQDTSELECIIHYCQIGKYNNYKINESQMNIKEDIFITKRNIINNKKNNNIKNIKSIVHLFVHIFKCGGGEVYIKNFIHYYEHLNHYIYVNSNYNNFIENELKNKATIIFYSSNDELINKLKKNYNDNQILLDHQYYLFEDININDELYKKNINLIRINLIHSIDYYHKEIRNINELSNYSIHLYNDKKMNKIWNNIIKPIHYLGVNPITNQNSENIIRKLKIIIQNKKYEIKNIAIIGRIDNHKINPNFIEALLKYTKKNNEIFNIYGNIEESYKIYFLKKIKNYNHIKYHGFIEYKNINTIYLNNDLVLSPSKSEAGGTILLEAMNYGCLLIARNEGGNKETIKNEKYLVETNSDLNLETEFKYFEVLNNIKNSNFENILYDILNSKKKILLKHNNQNHYNLLLNQISIFQIHNIQQENTIPNIIHYIYGLKEQTTEFPFLFYYGILSNILINQPTKIYFHYQYLPYGNWWNKIKRYLTLNYVNYENLIFNKIKVKHYAHKSDYLRLLILYHYGGIYYDIDTLCVKSHHELLNNKVELILGIQEKYKNELDLFGNAIIFSKKGNSFIKLLLINYDKYFNNNQWTNASLFMPTKLYQELNDKEKSKIIILEKEYFYYPNYNQMHLIYELENKSINTNLITFHYCNHSSKKYIENINYNNYINYSNNNNLFGKLMKNILNLFLNSYYTFDINQINCIEDKKEIKNKIYIIECINIEEQIEEIIKIENNYLILNNIYIIIYIHSNNINQLLDETKKNLIEVSYLKNVHIYYIKLYKDLDEKILKDISVFLVYNETIDDKINYSIISKLNTINIEVNKKYFIEVEKLYNLLNLFYVEYIYNFIDM